MEQKKNKILITGGCGYIGSQTIIELVKQNKYEIISADNFINSSAATLERIREISGREIKNYELDLRDKEKTLKLFEENKDLVGVIHFAALKSVPDSVADPILYYENNISSLLNILSACDQYQVDNLIFSSSCSVYGNVEKLPVDENTPLTRAESPYAHTKQLGEDIIRHFAKTSSVKTIALRYFNPVGADASGKIGENPINRPNNLVPVITQTAVGKIEQLTVFGGDYDTRDGSCIRDYVHVADIAKAHILALGYLIDDKNRSNFEIYNLGTGQGVTVLEAIKAFEEVSKQKLNYIVGPRREGDVASIYSNSQLAEERLGWKAENDIYDMMSSAWKWQLNLEKEQVK
ncbi:UDP-glucose 4-epimerase GalE [Cesiribacter sp. SM1]|uniref:UDP-glucose 4-epimerase GalE n=1 Tax=Cesiribacter sp. SM1 TaxID=2861196 RepID=UPI001CD80B33|nr:UDP-glucose 4-epimerase GalE [Cesiribacter sp. SM1]